jgi:glycosyltransferase involved in cell wall biosynthesis
MRFSVILPSLLADYPGAATGRSDKLIQAVESVLAQSFTDFELIVVADGCDLTEWLIRKIFGNNAMVHLHKVERRKLFSNEPRNYGISHARGEYIIYIDNDDRWGRDHLKMVNDNLGGEDWVYFTDYQWNGSEWIERTVDVSQYGRCGTSNICHASRLDLRWKDNEDGYGHDFAFIQQLRQFDNHKFIGPAEYFVCHIGGRYCV